MHSFCHSLTLIHVIILTLICSFTHPFIILFFSHFYLFINSHIDSSININSHIDSFVHLLMHSFTYWFICAHTDSLILSSSDPEVWFLENDHLMVTKTREEGTVPCLVTNPSIKVTLYEKDSEFMVDGSYNPSVGYTAALEDRTYKCKGELNGEEKESVPFYVFSILGTFAFWSSALFKLFRILELFL